MTDLSRLSDRYYRDQLRLARWTCSGGIVVLGGVVIGRLTLAGIEPALVPVYVAIAALEGFLLSIALLYAVPGPIELAVTEGSVTFTYKSGRVRSIGTRGPTFRFRLLERVVPPTGRRRKVRDEPGFFFVKGLSRIPLTQPAFDAITEELARAGVTPMVRQKSNRYEGVWRIREYARAVNRDVIRGS